MQEIIELTKELIRFRSMHSRPEEIQRCAAFIEDYLQRHRLRYRRLDSDGVPSLLVLPRHGFAPVLLMAHIDVVDAPDELFDPVVRDGKLYGRGSLDDKYAVALCLVLVKNWLRRLQNMGMGQEALPVGVLVTGDEETGGYHGAKVALRQLTTHFCIALDGGGIDKIVVKEKGVLRLKLTARGKAAHGARPWLGENAIGKLIADYQRVERLFEPSAPDPDHWHKTINFGMVHGGTAPNQVPDRAEAVFDIRYTEHDAVDELLERMRARLQGEISIEALEPLFVAGQSPYLDLLLSLCPESRTGFEHGASDARFLSEHGIKGVVWGAGGNQSQHSMEEHVIIDNVSRLYTVLDLFVDQSRRLHGTG